MKSNASPVVLFFTTTSKAFPAGAVVNSTRSRQVPSSPTSVAADPYSEWTLTTWPGVAVPEN